MSQIHEGISITDQERQKIRERRQRWLNSIEDVLNGYGSCAVSMLTEDMDDPPYSLPYIAALIFGGHRESNRVTALSALRDLAKDNWCEIQEDPYLERFIFLRLPLKRWTCPTCQGNGRRPRLTSVKSPFDPAALMVEYLCSHCRGARTVESRTNPENEITWIAYSHQHRMFIPKEYA